MDHEQRTKISRQHDPEWAGRVVRNIGQIEADFFHVAGPLSERMMTDAVLAIEKVATPPWQVIRSDWSAQVVCPEWKMTRGVGTGDMWLEISELSIDDDENEHSWIAAATKSGFTQLGIELMFRRGLQDHAESVIRDAKAIAALLKLGFTRDESSEALFIPIHIPAEKLAQGFEQNDLDPVLAPFGKAMTQAIAAKPELDKILELVRTAGKRS